MQRDFHEADGTTDQSIFNSIMSALWVAVEWSDKDIKQQWSRKDYSRALQVRQDPIASIHKPLVLLHASRNYFITEGQNITYCNLDRLFLRE